MTLKLQSLINEAQTIDSVAIQAYEVQYRDGTSVTTDIATAVVKRRLQCDVINHDSLFVDEVDSRTHLRSGTDEDLVIESQGTGSIDVTSGGDVSVQLEGDLSINGQTAVATQEVLVAGVGTLTFTHGILTGFVAA